jgi:hypothetical protein
MRTVKWMLAATAGGSLLITGCGDGDDPYRNAVNDRRAPEVTVTVRDDAGDQAADITYDASKGRIPNRATYAFLQTLDDDTWSTAYTMSRHLDDGFDEGVPDEFNDDAYGGPGPDTYRLPDLDADDTYRICISFVVGHPRISGIGCSAPFDGS